MSKKLSAIRGLVFAKLNLSYVLIVFLPCFNIIGQEKLNNSGSTS